MYQTVVIYESKYGATGRYAQWIAEELTCPLFKRKEFHPRDFAKYEVILYGGGLYAGGISGIKWIAQNWKLLSDKKVILFTCGIADPEDPDNVSHIREAMAKTLSPEILRQVQIFHLRGSMDYSRLHFIHRSMMAMLRHMLLKKEPNTLRDEDRQLLKTYGKHIDFTDCKSIQPLIQSVISLSRPE